MYCEKCGSAVSDDALFCENCGAKIARGEAGPAGKTKKAEKAEKTGIPAGQPVGGSGNIILCGDGKYRWYYEYPMLKNPTILFTVWKVLFISSLFPALLSMILTLTDGDGLVAGLKAFAMIIGVVFGILGVLSIFAYLILAATYGFKYIVLFEMDEKTVAHIQEGKQFKKAQAIGWLTAFAGAAGNNLSATGAGLLTASRQSMTSLFANVSQVVGLRSVHTIKVNQLLAKNQVYVYPEDYDFVLEFIVSHCPNAKVIR